ncbi:hypothetical protein PQX77_000243, partial [Marasmius sp. AFHP31]
MLKAAFKPIEELINAYLFCKPLRGNVGVQKTLIQSLPKPPSYYGDDDMTFFFDWVRTLVRWLNAADLCGRDVRWSSSRNTLDDPNPNRRPQVPYRPAQNSGPNRPRRNRPTGDRDDGDDDRRRNGRQNENNRDIPPHMNGAPGGSGGPPDGGDNSSDPDEPSASSGRSDDESEPEVQVKCEETVARFTSVDPALTERKKWVYDPTPQSEDEMLKAAFKPIEELINAYLFCKPLRGNVGVQKTLIQSLPKPPSYYGDDDMTFFFDWVRTLVRWLNAADLCGRDVRWSSSRNT